MRRADAEIGRIVREAMRGKRIKPRRAYDARNLPGYQESDRDFLENNSDVATALLEALAPKR